MNLKQLVSYASDKTNYATLDDYAKFGYRYLKFIYDGLQAIIVSQNENHYRFFQYKADGSYNVTRPINSNLMLSVDEFDEAYASFSAALRNIRDMKNNTAVRYIMNRFIYTCQQAIGATLDALPAGESNTARKINGDLFERYIKLLLHDIGVDVRSGTIKVPVVVDETTLFYMTYQHDLIVENENRLMAIGSVKTSSKDRIDKIFVDKFLYNRLTSMDTPHFAVFLNDVQRKGREPKYGVNTTFLAGHFKGYTIKLNPLDGVYYCDLRPVMETDSILKSSIRSLDCLLVEDIWKFLD